MASQWIEPWMDNLDPLAPQLPSFEVFKISTSCSLYPSLSLSLITSSLLTYLSQIDWSLGFLGVFSMRATPDCPSLLSLFFSVRQSYDPDHAQSYTTTSAKDDKWHPVWILSMNWGNLFQATQGPSGFHLLPRNVDRHQILFCCWTLETTRLLISAEYKDVQDSALKV